MDRLPIHQYIDMSLYVWWHYFADEESHGMERNTDLRQTGEQQVGESRECGGGRQGDHPVSYTHLDVYKRQTFA